MDAKIRTLFPVLALLPTLPIGCPDSSTDDDSVTGDDDAGDS